MKKVVILGTETPTPSNGYGTDFEMGADSWVALPLNTTENSWLFGTPAGDIINSASSGTNAWWTGGNPQSATTHTTYYGEEVSEVIGPCLNLTDLKRPMISIDYWADSERGLDGAVLQYSTDGAQTWEEVGDASGAGINWYNVGFLGNQIGNQEKYAWSGRDSGIVPGGWKTARFNLEGIPTSLRKLVVFRIAFGSNKGTLLQEGKYDGFAFDNIFIGEKTRNVLVEQFVNDAEPECIASEEHFNELFINSMVERDSSDFIQIQYHMAAPGADSLNANNPADPAARSLLYGVSLPPASIMDGLQGEYFGSNLNGTYQSVDLIALDRRALMDPLFDIRISQNVSAAKVIQGDVDFEYKGTTPYADPVILHLALVENGVGGHSNVLRELLWNPQGKIITTSWTTGQVQNEVFDYATYTRIFNKDSLYLIAFVQNKNTKEVLQTVISKVKGSKEGVIVGLPDDPTTAAIQGLDIYPNPASLNLNFGHDEVLPYNYEWKVIDQRGVTVLNGALNRDLRTPQQVDVSRIANGIYFLQIQVGNRSVMYRKIAIMNE
jgi:hypothetical protein